MNNIEVRLTKKKKKKKKRKNWWLNDSSIRPSAEHKGKTNKNSKVVYRKCMMFEISKTYRMAYNGWQSRVHTF